MIPYKWGVVAIAYVVCMAAAMSSWVMLPVFTGAAAALAAVFFSREELSLPLGILGTVAAMGKLVSITGMGSVFGLSILAIILGSYLLKKHRKQLIQEISSFRLRILNGVKLGLLGGVFFLVILVYGGFLYGTTPYFVNFLGISRHTAIAYHGIAFLWGAAGSLFAGWFLTIIKVRYSLLIGLASVLLLTYTLVFLISAAWLLVYMSFLGYLMGFIGTLVYSMAAVIGEQPGEIVLNLIVLTGVQSAARMAAFPVFSHIIADGDWLSAIFPGTILLLGSVIFAVLLYELTESTASSISNKTS